MINRIWVIAGKEVLQMVRHPRIRMMLFLPPIIQLIIFGYAVNLDVENIYVAWMDGDRTPESRELLHAFIGSGRFHITAAPQNDQEVRLLLDRGKVHAVVQVLPGFAADIHRGRIATVQILVDGHDSNSAALVSSYSKQVVSRFTATTAASRRAAQAYVRANSLGILSFESPRLSTRSRAWFNPDLQSRNFFIPGVVSNILLVVTVTLSAMAIVREKEIGTIEQLMVTPIRPLELIIGKIIPAAVVGLIDVMLITGASILVFNVPFRGSGFLLLGCSILFLLTSLGTGVFISAISHTQQQAAMSSFLFAAPAFMLSGFVFPIRNMPELVQFSTYANPLRHFMEIVRGIMLKGVDAHILWPQMLILAAYGLVIVGVSGLAIRKRVD